MINLLLWIYSLLLGVFALVVVVRVVWELKSGHYKELAIQDPAPPEARDDHNRVKR